MALLGVDDGPLLGVDASSVSIDDVRLLCRSDGCLDDVTLELLNSHLILHDLQLV